MAKRVRALMKGAKKVQCDVGPKNPASPFHLKKMNKGPSLPRLHRVVLTVAQVKAVGKKNMTRRKRMKIVNRLREAAKNA